MPVSPFPLTRSAFNPSMTQLMKTGPKLCGALLLLQLCASAQVSPPHPPLRQGGSDGPSIIEVGPHHRIWQTVSIDEEGQTNVSAFTEVATGLNFLDPATGEYLPSKESFQIAADGSAIAAYGQHRVRLNSDINS